MVNFDSFIRGTTITFLGNTYHGPLKIECGGEKDKTVLTGLQKEIQDLKTEISTELKNIISLENLILTLKGEKPKMPKKVTRAYIRANSCIRFPIKIVLEKDLEAIKEYKGGLREILF